MSRIAAICSCRYHRSAGFSLIEVLVAVLVLSIGLLGIAGLQIIGLRHTQSAYQNSHATAAVGDLIDRMHANPAGVSDGAYNDIDVAVDSIADLPDPGCIDSDAGCSPAQLASYDIRDWSRVSLSRLGGDASASVSGSSGTFTVTVTWGDVAAERNDGGDLEPRSMTTLVQLQ